MIQVYNADMHMEFENKKKQINNTTVKGEVDKILDLKKKKHF